MKRLVTCFISIAASNLFAAEPGISDSTLSERDYFEELPVVLSVSRLAQPLDEAPGAVTVIDREMIRQSGARQLVDLLRLVPGFEVASIPSPSGPPVAVYHGLGESYPRHMQVLLDGRSQYSPFFVGGVNWNLIPVSLDDIDHIEVMRGSNSAAYGANAVLGVVNIVTRHSQEAAGAMAEMTAGTQSVNDKHVRVGAAGRDFSIRYTNESRFDTGFTGFTDNVGRRLNDVRADWRLGNRDELQLQAGEIVTTQQVGSGDITDPLREQRQGQQYVQLGWRRTLSQDEELTLRYYRTEESASDYFAFKLYDASSPVLRALFVAWHVPNYDVPVDYGFHSVRNNVEATHTFAPWSNARLVWGGEVRSDAVRGSLYYGRSDEVSQTIARLFGNLEWRLQPAWIANFGATWEHDTNSKTTFAPRAAVNWHAAPGQTFRAAVSRAYRTPSLFETRANYGISSSTGVALDRLVLAQQGVGPETMTAHELGWVGDFKPWRLTTDVRAFWERLDDRLTQVPTYLPRPNCELLAADGPCGAADAIYNADRARIRGLEYQVRWQPIETTRLILNQSFIHIEAGMQVPSVGVLPTYRPAKEIIQTSQSAPTHATTLMAMQQLPGGIDVSAIYHSVGAMKWTNNTEAIHWQRLDWRVGYKFRVGPTRGELAYTVQCDGRPHAEHAATEILTPRSYVTLKLEY